MSALRWEQLLAQLDESERDRDAAVEAGQAAYDELARLQARLAAVPALVEALESIHRELSAGDDPYASITLARQTAHHTLTAYHQASTHEHQHDWKLCTDIPVLDVGQYGVAIYQCETCLAYAETDPFTGRLAEPRQASTPPRSHE